MVVTVQAEEWKLDRRGKPRNAVVILLNVEKVAAVVIVIAGSSERREPENLHYAISCPSDLL